MKNQTPDRPLCLDDVLDTLCAAARAKHGAKAAVLVEPSRVTFVDARAPHRELEHFGGRR